MFVDMAAVQCTIDLGTFLHDSLYISCHLPTHMQARMHAHTHTPSIVPIYHNSEHFIVKIFRTRQGVQKLKTLKYFQHTLIK